MFNTFTRSLANLGFRLVSDAGDYVFEYDVPGITITVYYDPSLSKIDVVYTTANAEHGGDDSYNNVYYVLGNIVMLQAEYA